MDAFLEIFIRIWNKKFQTHNAKHPDPKCFAKLGFNSNQYPAFKGGGPSGMIPLYT